MSGMLDSALPYTNGSMRLDTNGYRNSSVSPTHGNRGRNSSEVTPYGDDDGFLKGFNVDFSWDYPDDFCLKDIQDTVFYVYDEQQDSQRSESQFLCDSVQSAGAGILLLKPLHEADSKLPCELHIVPQASSLQRGEYCVLKLTIVSESKHLELYIDDAYEETSKGCMMTVKKGKKPALYECDFDLAQHITSSPKISIKFLSLGQNVSMRLQAVVVKVMPYPTSPQTSSSNPMSPSTPALNLNSFDMNGVRDMLDSMGLQIPSGANKIMNNIEHQQKQLQLTQLQGMTNVGLMAQLQHITQQQQSLQQQTQTMQLLRTMVAAPTTNPLANNLPFQQPGDAGNTLQQLLLGHQRSQGSPNTMSTASSNTSHAGSRTSSPRENGGAGNGRISSEGKYPISRETVPAPRSRRSSIGSSTKNRRSTSSLDRYDGFGTPNPPNESVLENAIRNEESSRELARSRASLIEERNIEKADQHYEKTQLELVKNFLRSQNSAQLTITKRSHKMQRERPRPPSRQSKEESNLNGRRPRPHSSTGIPTASEADFTKLLTGLMDQETNDTELINKTGETSDMTAQNPRWEAYLRSRVRASQRLSSASNSRPNSECLSDTTTGQDPFSPVRKAAAIQLPSKSEQQPNNRCQCCGCPGCGVSSDALLKQLGQMENRITERLEAKMHDVQDYMDRKINHMFELLTNHQQEALAQYNYMNVSSSAV